MVIDALDSLALLALFYENRSFQLLPVALWFPIFDVNLVVALNFGGLGGQVASALGLLLLGGLRLRLLQCCRRRPLRQPHCDP
ncbi:hypothetical protein MTO96_031181 [Rhipicephalus appendiculatus]